MPRTAAACFVVFASALLAGCAGAAPVAPPPAVDESRPTEPPVAVAAPPATTAIDAGRLDRARQLLRQLHREHLGSRVRLGADGPPSATEQLRCMAAADALVELQRQGDDAVFELGGTFYAILANELGIGMRVAPSLCDLLRSGEPRYAAFACEALGYLGWADARVHLQPMLQDRTEVPGYGDATLADFAAIALKQLDAAAAARR